MLTNSNIQLLNVTKNIHNHTQQLWPIKWDAKPHHYWVLCDFGLVEIRIEARLLRRSETLKCKACKNSIIINEFLYF